MIDYSDVDGFIARQDSSQTVILTTVNGAYLPLFERWWAGISRFQPLAMMVVTLDDEARQRMGEMGIPACDLRMTGEGDFIGELWIRRTEIYAKLVEAGLAFINTDIDAFWVRDPRPYFESCADDLSIQIAYGVPGEVRDVWGFVLCCGFFRLRSTPATRALMPDWLDQCRKVRHDQIALNQVFCQNGVDWGEGDDERGRRGVSGKHGVTIDVMAKSITSRQPRRDLTVYHPFLRPKPMWRKLRLVADGLRRVGDHPVHTGERLSSMLPIERLLSPYARRKTLRRWVEGVIGPERFAALRKGRESGE